MVKATHNQYIDINVNLSDNITVPIVKLGNDLEIPTIPFIWHREESLNIPIHSIIKISNATMKKIVQNHCVCEGTGSITKLIENNIHESYIVNQRTILEKVNYYISYHGIAYRENIKNDIECEYIPDKYNESIPFKSVIYPLINHDIMFSPSAKSKLYEISTGGAFIHNRSFSPPGCFHFKIKESSSDYIFLVHGINTKTKKTVTVLFVMINDHYEKEYNKIKTEPSDSIELFTKKLVDNIITESIRVVEKKIRQQSINKNFFDLLKNNFNNELSEELCAIGDIIKNMDSE